MAENTSDAGQPAWRKWLFLALKMLLVVIIIWALVSIIGSVDWAPVWDGVKRLNLFQVAVLLLLLSGRQILNAVPLALFAPGLSVRRSLVSDLSANLTATVAPPPGDVVLRVAMFRS